LREGANEATEAIDRDSMVSTNETLKRPTKEVFQASKSERANEETEARKGKKGFEGWGERSDLETSVGLSNVKK